MERVRAMVAAVVVGLLLGACSGGGSEPATEDLGLSQGETVVQFKGAGDLHLGGTLAMPANASGSVPAVVIVPSTGRVDRNGFLDVVPWDPVYQDMSKALTDAGLAAFRYDRRGIGTSKLQPDTPAPSFDDLVTDARQAVSFLGQRGGIDPDGLALVGHDVGGLVALRVAASEPRVKSLVLLSTPGRPPIDVMADSFLASHGQESADAFRAVVAGLLATGTLPDRTAIRPEHQPVLPAGQEGVLRQVFALDPAGEAAAVKAPVLVVAGRQSTIVTPADAERLGAVLRSSETVVADTTATLQRITSTGPQAVDGDHRAHGGGRPPDQAKRDQPTLDRITSFLTSKLA